MWHQTCIKLTEVIDKLYRVIRVRSSLSRMCREEKREHGRQFSCTVRGRQSGGFSSAKKFIHGGVEFCGWRVNDVVIIVFGFGRGNLFLDFLFLINMSVDSEFHGAPSTFCLPTFALGLISGMYQGAYGWLGKRHVVVGACWSMSWRRAEL